jgi:hypothetical protein
MTILAIQDYPGSLRLPVHSYLQCKIDGCHSMDSKSVNDGDIDIFLSEEQRDLRASENDTLGTSFTELFAYFNETISGIIGKNTPEQLI